MQHQAPIHAKAWLCWLAAAVVILSVTRNPLYIGMTLLWLAVVDSCGMLLLKPQAIPFSAWRAALVILPLTTLFNALNVHIGTTILFTLPRSWPLIGGPVTLEALSYGLLNGLVLVGLLAAFLFISRILTVRELVGLIPQAYYPIAIVVTIALTYIPLTIRQWHAIREAQAIRGHQIRGPRDWLPLLLPLLLNGMERALQLAEAISARGFVNPTTERYTTSLRLVLVGSLCTVLAGLALQLRSAQPYWPQLLLVIGLLGFAGALWQLGRAQQRTAYRASTLQIEDWLIMASALMTVSVLLFPIPQIDRTSLIFYPYPTLSLPSFTVPMAMATWSLLVPAFVLILQQRKRGSHD